MLSNISMGSPKKVRNLEQTRKEILSAAFTEIFEQGFHAASIDGILKRTRLTKGALFHQFPTKLELGYAVVNEVISPLARARWIDPLEEFENPLDGILHQLKKNIGGAPQSDLNLGCPLNNLVQEMSNSDPKFQRRLTAAIKDWVDGIEGHILRGQKSGQIVKSVNARDVAEYIVMAHEGFFGIIKGLRDKTVFKSLLRSLELYFESIRIKK